MAGTVPSACRRARSRTTGRAAPAEHHLLTDDPAALATRCAARSAVLTGIDDPTPELRDPADDVDEDVDNDLDDGTLLGALLTELIRFATGGPR